MSYDVVLTLWPTRAAITVTDQEAQALYAQGLVYSSTPTLGVPVFSGTAVVDGGTASARVALLKIRAGTAAQWATAESSAAVLSAGEFAVVDNDLVKGDGTTKVASLPRAGTGTYVPRQDDPASYTYDASGNVATETVNGATTTYTYNADGTVATSTRNGVTRTYTYSAGRITGIA